MEATQEDRDHISVYLNTHSMTSSVCASRWTLTQLVWTSTQIRNQNTTRIQISFVYRESFGYQFDHQQMIRQVTTPIMPVDPTMTAVYQELESRGSKRGMTSPSPSVAPETKRRRVQTTQTDLQNSHFQRLPRKSLFS